MGTGSVVRLILLGSTGSIGKQTVEVVRHLNALHREGSGVARFEVVGLAAGRNAEGVMAQARELGVREVALASGADGERGDTNGKMSVRRGADAAERLVREVECDMVLGAMVGSAGIPATLAAVELGRDVALANKETLVAAGALVVAAARKSGAKLLPVDSEHSGVWQCLGESTKHKARSTNEAEGIEGSRGRGIEGGREAGVVPPCEVGEDVARVILTASGGALRSRTKEETYHAAPEDALKHPTWSMGAKVTIDSASLTNKALEIIEAHWLFGLEAERIGVLVHPQSIVHAIVEYADGSSIAQCGAPDMKTPIQLALTWPMRSGGCSGRVKWEELRRLDFEPPDMERFPALELGYRVLREGGTSGAVLNAANEAAVGLFLEKKIPFGRIPELAREAMDEIGSSPVRSLGDVVEADAEARRFVALRV